MKIGFVAQPTDVAPPAGGASIAIWIDEVARRLTSRCQVTVYSREAKNRCGRERLNGVFHCRVSTAKDNRFIRWIHRAEMLLRWRLHSSMSFYFRSYYFTRLYYFFYVLAIARQARRDDIDVIIVSNYAQFLPLFRAVCRRSRFVLMMHCDWLIELPRRRAAQWAGCADLILGVSNYIVDGIRHKHPQLASRCAVLYNASNTTQLEKSPSPAQIRKTVALPDEQTVLLYTGRITPEKGVHVLIEAMAQVLEAQPDCILLLAGSFALNPPSPRLIANAENDVFEDLKVNWQQRLYQQAEPLGPAVKFLGDVPHDVLWTYYRTCDVFVHPALWSEPFGMTLTEAMACERPVVATRVGGIPEIVVNGETGLLVEPGDATGLANAILRLTADKVLRSAMGLAGRQRVETKFTWDSTVDTLFRLIGTERTSR